MLPFLLCFASARLEMDICKMLSDEISTTLLFNVATPNPGTLDTRNGPETCVGAHAPTNIMPCITVLQGQLALSLCSLCTCSTIVLQKGGEKKKQHFHLLNMWQTSQGNMTGKFGFANRRGGQSCKV